MIRALSILLLLGLTAQAQVPPFPAMPTNRVIRPHQAVTLIWNPSTDPNVTGYNVYYGVASRTYTNKLDVGSATNATVRGLVIGAAYYFAATAYNLLGVESDYSSEVSYTVPTPQPRPVVITLVASVLSSPDPGGPWTECAIIQVTTLTNPTGNKFFRAGPLKIAAQH
jgi:hypothetical protein